MPATHLVTNQVPAISDLPSPSPWDGGVVLREAVERHGAGEQAERHSPVLRTHDARGNRLDEVEHHPASHQLMRVGVEHGLGGGAWSADPTAVAGAARWLVERLAVALQASLLVRHSTRKVAEAFLATRVERQGGSCLGTLPVGDRTTRAVVERAVGV